MIYTIFVRNKRKLSQRRTSLLFQGKLYIIETIQLSKKIRQEHPVAPKSPLKQIFLPLTNQLFASVKTNPIDIVFFVLTST